MGAFSMVSAAARRLEGKVAIITGGAGGIGSVTAKIFCQHGAKVLIADVQDNLANSLCKDIGPAHASFVHCDVTNEIDVRNAVDKAVSEHGKLDVMFNNAAILDAKKPDILDIDKSVFEDIVRVNLLGPFLGTKHAARVMRPARSGSIINTASVSGVIGGVATHAYVSSKHGVVGLTKNTAVDLGRFGVRVNCVSPYNVPTSMPRKFMNLKGDDDSVFDQFYCALKGVSLSAEDIARAVMYLASDESKYVNGHNLVVDGGFTIVNGGYTMFDE